MPRLLDWHPLPALQSALEAGFGALQQRALAGGDTALPERELGGFDKSAIEQIHRILIETGREELNQLETREKARIRDQNLSLLLLGVAGLWTGLALLGLYRETTRLIRAGIHAEQTIRQLSLRDPLTGLANRRSLHESEKHLIASAKRSGKLMAVLAVDLDDFKAVNDSYGHAAGDQVLVTSAERMKLLLRESDVIARFGGDEFVIVLGQIDDAEAVREVASRVVNSLCQPMQLAGGRTAHIGASVGIAICRAGKETLEDHAQESRHGALRCETRWQEYLPRSRHLRCIKLPSWRLGPHRPVAHDTTTLSPSDRRALPPILLQSEPESRPPRCKPAAR